MKVIGLVLSLYLKESEQQKQSGLTTLVCDGLGVLLQFKKKFLDAAIAGSSVNFTRDKLRQVMSPGQKNKSR